MVNSCGWMIAGMGWVRDAGGDVGRLLLAPAKFNAPGPRAVA
jgi:hypothetical protein